MQDLPAIRLTDEDYLINIPNELSPRDITEDSYDWGSRYNIIVKKFEVSRRDLGQPQSK
jgi:hypothetical protein